MENCSLLKYTTKLVKEEVQTIAEDNKHIKKPGEIKLFEWIKKNFAIMEFQREFSANWSNSLRYDFGSIKFKTVIESDGVEHYKFIPNIGNFDYKTRMKIDKLKNKLAIENHFTIIRICQEDIIKDKCNWHSSLFNYLEHIKQYKINNAFLWVGSSELPNKVYSSQMEHLYPIIKLKDPTIPDETLSLSTPTISEENNIKQPEIPISTIVKQINTWLKALYPEMQFDSPFKPKWLRYKRSFSLGSEQHKIVIVIDYTFFEDFFGNDSLKIRNSELDKTNCAIKHGYSCIRVYHKLVENEAYVKKHLKYMIDSIIDNKTPSLFCIPTNIEDLDKIYASFKDKVSC